MRHVEFLIIGQGISGTFVSWYLKKAGRRFLVIDNGDKSASTRIAAGIINPVTGRRIVQTWMIDTLLPYALSSYREIGKELNINSISQKNTIDFFPSPQMLQAFANRIIEDPKYLSVPENPDEYRSYFNYDFGYGEIAPCYAVDLPAILAAWKNILQQTDEICEEDFRLAELSISGKGIFYKDITADRIIFCDGIHSSENPWFEKLPFALNKGEALIIRSDELPTDKIFKRGLTIVPLKNDFFWVGSSYEWNFNNAAPTELFRQRTTAQLNHWLKSSYTIEDHLASLRPATIERRPFIGVHPRHPQLVIFNGMGTKGCSLAPYFANELANHLIGNSPLLPEVNINRFRKILQ